MKPVEYESALVMGLGASGIAAARLLAKEGACVTAIDSSNTLAADASGLVELGVEVKLGVEKPPDFDFDICIVSPGIAMDSEWVKSVNATGIPVLPELELGWSRCRSRMIAITGTNGKSTAAKLCAEAIQLTGVGVVIGGNYGRPLSDICMADDMPEWIVAEVSSFQLESISSFRPNAGLLLNIQPDHLDRHRSMERYTAIKLRMFENMGQEDTAIIHSGLRHLLENLGEKQRPRKILTFGIQGDEDVSYSNGTVTVRDQPPTEAKIDMRATAFDNDILGQAAAAVAGCLMAVGIDPALIGQAAKAFMPLPHRMTRIGSKRNVSFVDDSKATNLAAMAGALSMSGDAVRLIAGGLLKEDNLDYVKEMLAKKVRTVYLVGRAAERMQSAWSDSAKCVISGTVENAVEQAWADSGQNETILLSPGCASFDQFSGYAERGTRFVECVEKILEEG